MNHPRKVFLISLGCSKNLVDSESILGLLHDRGIRSAQTLEEADMVIINTCGFIQSAVEESIDTILEVSNKKKKGEIDYLFVVGCFVQRYGYKLSKEIPEVDGWLGTGELDKIPMLIQDHESPPLFFISRPTALADHTTSRIQTTPFYTAYLRIAEGCSHRCSYCIIPALRGPFRSRTLESLAIEAKRLIDHGVKEINIIAQDTTMYGRDLKSHPTLITLLENLLLIKGLDWIRIFYCHPVGVSDQLLSLLGSEEALCPYIDIPFQHVNPMILRSMGRDVQKEDPRILIEKIRSLKRDISIRTTLMVGFPGETDEIFDELHEFVSTASFDHMGAFIFSPEKGTPAARMQDIPDKKVAKKRLDNLMKLQRRISKEKNRSLIGRTLPVLIEGVSEETDLLLSGRTAAMAPDVDARVLINKGEGIVGEFSMVRITEAYPYDLVGEIV
ncbi:MAG: 30S ribosomal protein S12 methylthiotransferase RimO [Deltaproteobacteria bacterium]|nr:30S ribosomal protein S12 methylthiotransferase RimO [Deltaproteobacteria bacterium]